MGRLLALALEATGQLVMGTFPWIATAAGWDPASAGGRFSWVDSRRPCPASSVFRATTNARLEFAF